MSNVYGWDGNGKPALVTKEHASTHAANGSDAMPNIVTGGQSAIADLNLASPTLLADTAATLNAILARLRSSGVTL